MLNQIPIEGEYCGKCPCQCQGQCNYFLDKEGYPTSLKMMRYGDLLCLPQCLSDKPQILTEKGRKELINDFLRNQLKELRDEPKPC